MKSPKICNICGVCFQTDHFCFMRQFIVPYLILLFSISLGIDSAECEQKGFSPSLLCSSCDKLSAFVGDSTGRVVNVP